MVRVVPQLGAGISQATPAPCPPSPCATSPSPIAPCPMAEDGDGSPPPRTDTGTPEADRADCSRSRPRSKATNPTPRPAGPLRTQPRLAAPVTSTSSPAAPIAVRSTRTPSLPCVSAPPVRQLHRRHDQRRTTTRPSLDRLRPLVSSDAIRPASLTEHHDAVDLPPCDDADLDDNPGNGRTVPAARNRAFNDCPENRFTHRHPAVPATGAAGKPAVAEPGAASC